MSLLTTNSSIHLNEPNPQSLIFGRVVRLKNSTENKIGGGGTHEISMVVFHRTQRLPHSTAALRFSVLTTGAAKITFPSQHVCDAG